MSGQKLKNELTKSVWKMLSNIKDVVSKNIVKASNTKDIPIPREHIQKLIYLIQASVDEAFEGSLKEFQKEIERWSVSFVQEESAKKK